MKKVMSEEEKARNRQLMHEILDIVLDTNGFEDRSRGRTGTLPTVNTRFFGHVSALEISLYEDGWTPGAEWKDFKFETDRPIDETAVENFRTACRMALTDKTEVDVLERDIKNQERTVAEERRNLSRMRKKLARMTREEEER